MHPTPEIMRSVKAVRPLPDVAQRVLGLVQNPDYAIDDLVAIVRTDPTLVARVLRLCNSARTGLDTQITSIGNAITYLGSRNLVQLVLVTCSAGMFAGTRGSMYVDPTAVWQHSIACAFACQAIAARTGEAVGATAFTLGILHDVGKIALSSSLDESRFVSALADPEVRALDLITFERQAIGFDHAMVAGLVADHWQLPPTLTNAMRHHHDDTRLRGECALPAMLQVADILALQAGLGNPFPGSPPRISPIAIQRLSLRAEDLAALRATLTAELAKATELLNLVGVASR